jgi:PRTRC genetic system ThiF family protein
MIALDTDFAKASVFMRPQVKDIEVIQIGCGGTGSWLAPALVRLARATTHARVSLTFVDHDHVEESNLVRQNFPDAHIGWNKAKSLAIRYGFGWGIEAAYVPRRFDPDLIQPTRGKHTLLVGCVDNAAARNAIYRAVGRRSGETTWLDCGNFEESGQVALGNACRLDDLAGAFDLQGFCTRLPVVFWLRQNLRQAQPEELSDNALSCEDIAARNAQAFSVNDFAARIAAHYVAGWLSGTLRHFITTFNLKTLSMRSLAITPERVIAELQPEAGTNPGNSAQVWTTDLFRAKRKQKT